MARPAPRMRLASPFGEDKQEFIFITPILYNVLLKLKNIQTFFVPAS